mmetsp:Transcript_177841/g.570370  ORF Transcript_177841/g.570370 Transcript_177841/m.570370 type:complete len:257 (+) Transcript_177841:903-1673(+)
MAVVLAQRIRSHVPNVDRRIPRAGRHGGPGPVEADAGDAGGAVVPHLQCLATLHIPQPHSLIVAARCDQRAAAREHGGPHPIRVSAQRRQKAPRRKRRQLQQLVIRAREHQASVLGDVDRSHRTEVHLEQRRRLLASGVGPHGDRRVHGRRHNELARGRRRDTRDGGPVAAQVQGPGPSEVEGPDEDLAILGARREVPPPPGEGAERGELCAMVGNEGSNDRGLPCCALRKLRASDLHDRIGGPTATSELARPFDR